MSLTRLLSSPASNLESIVAAPATDRTVISHHCSREMATLKGIKLTWWVLADFNCSKAEARRLNAATYQQHMSTDERVGIVDGTVNSICHQKSSVWLGYIRRSLVHWLWQFRNGFETRPTACRSSSRCTSPKRNLTQEVYDISEILNCIVLSMHMHSFVVVRRRKVFQLDSNACSLYHLTLSID